MAVDIQDIMANAVEAVETALREQLRDSLAEVLDNVVAEVEANYDEDWGTDHASGEVDPEDEETTFTAAEVHELLAAAFKAGYEQCTEVTGEAIESAKWTG